MYDDKFIDNIFAGDIMFVVLDLINCTVDGGLYSSESTTRQNKESLSSEI